MFVKLRMTSHPFTVTPENSLPDAIEVMRSRGVRHLPVVEGDRVVGVLSHSDIAAAGPSASTTFSAGEVTYLLAKLKVECGYQFTQKLEGMFHDIRISNEHMTGYQEHILKAHVVSDPSLYHLNCCGAHL